MASLFEMVRNLLAGLSTAERIEHSKPTWTHLVNPKANSKANSTSNVEDFKKLQQDPRWGRFFHTFRDGELVAGKMIGEGAQAVIFEVEIKCRDRSWGVDERDLKVLGEEEYALKVFKDDSLQNLQIQWPEGMLKHHLKRVGTTELIPRFNCDVQCGTLLETGRFAFLMQKEQFDLRTLIDQAMKLRPNQNCGPFSKEVAGSSMEQIARGMMWLHDLDIIHKDMKAANVLVTEDKFGQYYCFVADYECSLTVEGTGFWRAPEILRAFKERKNYEQRKELFTREADIYSYAMTCYEILTGELPFAGHPVNDYDLVLSGERPTVPEYVDDWARELLCWCWKSKPEDRPSFEKILNLIQEELKSGILGDTTYGQKRRAYWTKLVTEMISMYDGIEEYLSVEERIEHSKQHWSQVVEVDFDDEEYYWQVQNGEIFETLQRDSIWGGFFMRFGDNELEIGEKFAEGGQAELFYAQVNWHGQFHHEVHEFEYVVKVFKKGTLLRHLQSQFPNGMLQYSAERIDCMKTGTTLEWEKPKYVSNIFCGTLLSDGRYAFVMEKEDEDLRQCIDRSTVQDCGPFSKEIAEKIMHSTALGMAWLHDRNIVHRDLKASNVLVRRTKDGSYNTFIADYECSIGVVGTGFWRAPEVLQGCKEKNIHHKPE
jgi:serine/threonine protein kinase